MSGLSVENKVDQFFTALHRDEVGQGGFYVWERLSELGTEEEQVKDVLSHLTAAEMAEFRSLVEGDKRAHQLSVEELIQQDFSGAELGHMLGLLETVGVTHLTQKKDYVAQREQQEQTKYQNERTDSIYTNLPRLGGMLVALGTGLRVQGLLAPMLVGTLTGAVGGFGFSLVEHSLRGKEIDLESLVLRSLDDAFSTTLT